MPGAGVPQPMMGQPYGQQPQGFGMGGMQAPPPAPPMGQYGQPPNPYAFQPPPQIPNQMPSPVMAPPPMTSGGMAAPPPMVGSPLMNAPPGMPAPPPIVAPPPMFGGGGGGIAPPPPMPSSMGVAPPPPVLGGGGALTGPSGSAGGSKSGVLVGFLITFQNEPQGIFWAIHSGDTGIGRAGSDKVEIGINDASASSKHAVIHADPATGQAFVEDMNSRNGTFLNERKLNGGEQRQLHDNDRLRLGSTTLVVKLLVS